MLFPVENVRLGRSCVSVLHKHLLDCVLNLLNSWNTVLSKTLLKFGHNLIAYSFRSFMISPTDCLSSFPNGVSYAIPIEWFQLPVTLSNAFHFFGLCTFFCCEHINNFYNDNSNLPTIRIGVIISILRM